MSSVNQGPPNQVTALESQPENNTNLFRRFIRKFGGGKKNFPINSATGRQKAFTFASIAAPATTEAVLKNNTSLDCHHHCYNNCSVGGGSILHTCWWRVTYLPARTRAVLFGDQLLRMLPYTVSLIGSWYYQVSLLVGFFTSLWLMFKYWRHAREQQIRVIPASWNGIHAHQWSLIQFLTHQATCCLCRSLIVDAMYCDSCGVCLDFGCYQNTVTRSFKSIVKARRKKSIYEPLSQCKTVSISTKNSERVTSPSWKHQWIHGNVPVSSKCFICNDYCDDYEPDEVNEDFCVNQDAGDATNFSELSSQCNYSRSCMPTSSGHTLYHYRCCWCQRAVHESCFDRNQNAKHISGSCDFGKYRRFVIPPYCIIHKRVRSPATQGKFRAIILDSIKDFTPEEPNWSPLFVVANRKSGNNDAGAVLSKFLPILNPLQVIDLGDKSHSLELSLQICKMLPPHVKVRILVAGGDGTVGWVLNTIHQLNLDPIPLVAIYPLGTGNDLARVLHWHISFDNSVLNVDQVIETLQQASSINLDRWSVDIRPTGYYRRSYSMLISSLHIPQSIIPMGNRSLFMYNYFSVGVDALVALNFHETRKSKLYKFLFTNTLVNKFIYFTYGTKDLLERRCKNLHTKIQLELDGRVVPLPELESIVVLNIASWGGGVQLLTPRDQQQMDDQQVEVLGLMSTFHIGQVMIGLSKPIFLGQGRSVRLLLNEHLPVQVDGEPWLQSPAQIEINWSSHAKLLRSSH